MQVRDIKKKMKPYSARKIRVNIEDPKSTLKPLTNSLSPSEKSKGVRFNSPKTLKNQKKNM